MHFAQAFYVNSPSLTLPNILEYGVVLYGNMEYVREFVVGFVFYCIES